MTEQSGPNDLIAHAIAAEQAGFDFEVSSDHYFPWLAEMGHSPNAWVTLGAIAHATGVRQPGSAPISRTSRSK